MPPESTASAIQPAPPAGPGATASRWFSAKRLRFWHLYLGVFFAPLLLFFIGTGWYQIQNRDRLKDASEAETLVQKFRVVHTDQIYPSEQEFKRRSSPKWFGALVGTMSAAMIITTVLGLVLAFRFSRNPWPACLALGMGILVPILVLWAGQQH
jgi:uncharacterized iron-regulated membrane protein